MNAKTVANTLRNYLNTNNEGVATVRAINARWVYVNDATCGYYLDARDVRAEQLDRLINADPEADAYTTFCGGTNSLKFADLPAGSKRDALAELGDTARNTGGW